jgi:signal transduction histidine kinase
MNSPLRILFVEDNEDDMLLQLRELRQVFRQINHLRVESADALRFALANHTWDVILSDFSLPGFGGLEALKIVRAVGGDIPFILISGTVGEEVAVESMRAGAADYLLKANLTRLGPAITRELREAADRRERKKAESALRENRALLSLVYEHTSEMLALFSSDEAGEYRLTSVNRAWSSFFRKLTGEVPQAINATLAEVLQLLDATPIERETLCQAFAKAACEGAGQEFGLDWLRDARVFNTEQHFIPVLQGERPYRHLLWAAQDITERKQVEAQRRRLETQLFQAQKLETVGTLASSIAHDFNNILLGLSGYTEMIRQETVLLPEVHSMTDKLLQGIQRASDLTGRILAFSHKRPVVRQAMHLGPIVVEILDLLRPTIPNNIQVQWQGTERESRINADAVQMHQIVLNLCTNAIHAMRETGGTLRIALETVTLDAALAAKHGLMPGTHVRLQVQDTGRGISPEVLPKLFEPFFTTRQQGSGTGLGLATILNILKIHQASINVQSEVGQGATFTLYFPIIEETPTPASPTERAMIVEPEDTLRRLQDALLSRLGYSVDTFGELGPALAAIRAKPHEYRLLVIAEAMPEVSSGDLISRLREICPSLKIVLLVGGALKNETDSTLQANVVVLEKPYTVEQLAAAIKRTKPAQ